MREDLDDLLIVEAGHPQRLNIAVGNLRTLLDHLQRESQCSGGRRVTGLSGLRGGHLLTAGAGLAAQCGVRGQAVRAGIAVGDGHGDLLAQQGRQATTAQRAERTPHAVQGGRRVGHGAEHGRGGAEGGVDLAQQGLAVGGGVGGIDQGDTGHGGSPWKRARNWTTRSS